VLFAVNSTILRRWSTTEILFYFSVISPPCIAMPKAYILPLWFFSFFFFRRLISEVTERISTELGHIFTYDWYFKNWSEVWLRALPQRGGGRNRFFWDRLRTSTENISATEIKSSIYRMILYAPQIWWILVHKGWERLASFFHPPLMFARRTSCRLTFAIHFGLYHIRQMAPMVNAVILRA